jgi:hypothetical protein
LDASVNSVRAIIVRGAAALLRCIFGCGPAAVIISGVRFSRLFEVMSFFFTAFGQPHSPHAADRLIRCIGLDA